MTEPKELKTAAPKVATGEPAPAAEAEAKKRTRAAKAKSYPATPLEKVVKVALAIKDNSRGKEMARIPLATALDWSPASSGFRSLIADSAAYDLTKGNYNSEVIVLTDLGLSYVRPRDDGEAAKALRDAALKPPLFAKLYAKLDQAKWPDATIENILVRDFEVPAAFAKEAAEVAKANAVFAGLLMEAKKGLWLTLNADLRRKADEAADQSEADEVGDEDIESPASGSEPVSESATASPTPTHVNATALSESVREFVFISHSKNPAILDQIKTILDYGQFIPVIAEEEETAAIPVPEKVLSAMKRCGSAVINVSADESEKRTDNTYGINQNVLIEIGVAFALYDRRVVLVVDKRVTLPSNLQGLYRCEYEGDELGWNAGMKLQKSLANFRER